MKTLQGGEDQKIKKGCSPATFLGQNIPSYKRGA
ncbi:hypothetical protein FHX64_001249 [Microbacter margulisiae]|uniref:Uncharacterized protein n=1 Tax=Microbacter margulisiae TaxID=1350067 RepID=A0A7W5H267_9PORP|nr:hypothetical protein [Microbacter margulisiae]